MLHRSCTFFEEHYFVEVDGDRKIVYWCGGNIVYFCKTELWKLEWFCGTFWKTVEDAYNFFINNFTMRKFVYKLYNAVVTELQLSGGLYVIVTVHNIREYNEVKGIIVWSNIDYFLNSSTILFSWRIQKLWLNVIRVKVDICSRWDEWKLEHYSHFE